MLSTNKSKFGNTLPELEIIKPSALYLPSQFLLRWDCTSSLSCLTPNTLSYIRSLNAVLLLKTTACSTNSVWIKQPKICLFCGGVIVILLSCLTIKQSLTLIIFPSLSVREYCSFSEFLISDILPVPLSNSIALAIGLSTMLSFCSWFSVVQNRNLLPANNQSFISLMLVSKSPKSYPDACWCLPIPISKSNTSATSSKWILYGTFSVLLKGLW